MAGPRLLGGLRIEIGDVDGLLKSFPPQTTYIERRNKVDVSGGE